MEQEHLINWHTGLFIDKEIGLLYWFAKMSRVGKDQRQGWYFIGSGEYTETRLTSQLINWHTGLTSQLINWHEYE